MARFFDDDGFSLYEWDKYSGRTVWMKETVEGTIFRTDYPVDSITKLNAEHRAIADRAWKGDYHQIASIPLNLLYDSGLNEAATQQDGKFLSKWLNDSDNRAFRTKEGRV